MCVNPNWIPGVYEEQCTQSSAEFRICIYTYTVCGHGHLSLYHGETHQNHPNPEGKHNSAVKDKHKATRSRHLMITWL